jgi:NADH-quinone oxidoreductase subunit G
MSENKLTQTDATLNPPTTDLVNIKINGVAVQVPKGENIIESARRIGVDIPYFCYHPRLSKGDAANCRMCLVEVASTAPDGSVRKMPKPQAACTMPASEGMVVETETPMIIKDRKGILEFLLINHPLDCPVCDRGGECPLQNNTLFYGPPTSRFIEEKRHYPKAYPLSEHVVFDRERCIQCARCTRFTEDISGDSQLGFLKRGADIEVGSFANTAYESKFSGNVIELCPVGALLSRDYRFKARPWDLLTQKSVCSRCSNGCNIKLDYRVDKVQRVNARLNEEVNEEWTCDRGKFGHGYISSDSRLKQPLVKRGDKWEPISWKEAYALLASKLKEAGTAAAGIGGAHATNEDAFVFQKLFREVLKSGNIDSRIGNYQGPGNGPVFSRLGYHSTGTSIADIENKKTIFVIGSELADEQPIVFLRVRKAARFKGASVINALDRVVEGTTNTADFAAVNLIYRPGTEVALLNGLLNLLLNTEGYAAPEGVNTTAVKSAVAEWTAEKTAAETGLDAAEIVKAASLLASGSLAVIAGKSVTEHANFPDAASALCNLVIAAGQPDALNIPVTEFNAHGAADMGVLPDIGPGYTSPTVTGLNTRGILEAAAAGTVKALWIVGEDLLENYADRALAEKALENCPFIVINELSLTRTASMADLILPVASIAEKDGTVTSCERRIQRIHRAFDISGEVKPDWLVFAETAELLGAGWTYVSARDIWRDIASAVPTHKSITLKSLGESGIRWSYAQPAPAPTLTAVPYKAPATGSARA